MTYKLEDIDKARAQRFQVLKGDSFYIVAADPVNNIDKNSAFYGKDIIITNFEGPEVVERSRLVDMQEDCRKFYTKESYDKIIWDVKDIT